MKPRTVAELAAKHFQHGLEALTARERAVLDAVVKRTHVSRPLHRELDHDLTFGQRVADNVARFGGSWTFMGLFFAFLVAWMVVNTVALLHPYDPYPFILLNLILSCLASVQAPVILMSQRRQADNDRLEATHDYEVNLKAEIEIMQLHEKIDLLRAQELARIVDMQASQAHTLEMLVARMGPPT